ncbi:MAG: hypothetical protein HDR20_06370 [Lachnospiraceae bacterium]|nr:hypothetical protein [Lachnospiraceae bacterium]
MKDWTECVVYYPLIRHPLSDEKEKLKRKYVALIKKYAEKYEIEEKRISDLQMLQQALFGEDNTNLARWGYTDHDEEEVLKTRFSRFKFFSYRYLFLFDCLMLFAISDNRKGKHICEEIKRHVHSRYHKKIDTMVSMMYSGDEKFADKTLISIDMVKAWKDARKYSQSRKHSVFFTATMSAGKSTLINSIIGEDLSGTKKAACTSNIIRFHAAPNINDRYTIINADGSQYLKDVRHVQECVRNSTRQIDIVGYFSSVLHEGKYTLVDTPGVDSSLNPQHKELTRKELSDNNPEILVYVIPVETYGSEDDYNHLKYVLKKVLYERIIFVVNMMDTYDPEDDSVEDILQNIRDHLLEIGFENPIVCPVSAKAGLLIKKMVRNTAMTDNERESAENFIKLFSKPEYNLGKYYPLVKNEGDYHSRALLSTGIPGLEQVVFGL